MIDLSEYMPLDEAKAFYRKESGFDMPTPLLQIGFKVAGVRCIINDEEVFYHRQDVINELPNFMQGVKTGREKHELLSRITELERRLVVIEARLSPTTAAAGA